MSQRLDPDHLSRIIVLILAVLEDGGPCWIYAAVKPSMSSAGARFLIVVETRRPD